MGNCVQDWDEKWQSIIHTACTVDTFKVHIDLFIGRRRYEH